MAESDAEYRERRARGTALVAAALGCVGAVSAILRTEWLSAGLAAIYTAILLAGYFPLRRSHQRQARWRAGLCPECGYDLRESKERCPECGSSALSKRRLVERSDLRESIP